MVTTREPPWAPLQPLLVAETVFVPAVAQMTEIPLPVAEPEIVPSPTLQLQPVLDGVQLEAEAAKTIV